MIPADVDIDDLARQLEEDSVAVGEARAGLGPALLDVVEHAEGADFGTLGIVVLDHTPPRTADLRDVAQDLQLATDLDTVLLRTPSSGAVVSDVHDRARLESAQHLFLGDPDIPGAANRFVDQVVSSGVNWGLMTAVAVILMVIVAAATAQSALSNKGHTLTSRA